MESTETTMRKGTKFIYELKPGDRWIMYGDYVIIANPDQAPFLIDINTLERFELCPR